MNPLSFLSTLKSDQNKCYCLWIFRSFLLVSFLLAGITANAQFTITENFRGNSASGITIGPGAVLTSGNVDPVNDGWLRLTPAVINKSGYAYINQSFPSTLGVLADFEYKTWRPTTTSYGGADGLSVFLFDAAVSPFKLGPNGGSLGYTANTTTPGLSGGYIGLGLDEFGNFSATQGGPGQRPNSVVLRGPTTPILATSNLYLASANVPTIGYGTLTATRPTDAQFYRRVQIEITPTGLANTYEIVVRWKTSPTGAFVELFRNTLTTALPVPEKLKIGFASSTGAGYNNHEIRNLIVTTPGGVRILKSVDKPTANVGDPLTYTMELTNQTNSQLNGLSFQDNLPAGFQVTDVQFLPNGTASTASGFTSTSISSASVNLAPSATGTFVVKGRVSSYPAGGILTNTGIFNTGTSGVSDPDKTNDTSSVKTVIPKNDFSITKTVNLATPRVNGNVAFTLTVKNNGTFPATGVKVDDLLPAGYTYLTSSPTTGAYNSTTGIWTIGNLASAGRATLTINAKVLATGPYLNSARVSANEFDENTSNNTATATTAPIPPYDLAIVKVADRATAVAGQPLSYTITLTNNGPSPVLAADVINVTDNLPEGFTASSYNAASGTYTSSNGSWTGLTLASGQSTTLTIAGTVNPTATAALNNTVVVSTPTDITDPVLSNNTYTVSTPLSRVLDLGVTKTSNPATVIAGQPLSYTITLTNNGPSSLLATDIVNITDNLPGGFTASTYTASNGTYTSSNGNWTGLTLASGQSGTLNIAGTVSPSASGTLTNTVTLTPPAGTTDPTSGNQSATATTTVIRQIDFSITKTASPKPAVAGQALSYTLTLKNNGLSSLLASDIVNVTDNLPAGFTATSYLAASGTYSSANGNWTGLTLANGQSTTLIITGTLNAAIPAGNLTNTAIVTVPAGITDPTPDNNTATDVTAVTRVIDLGLSKTASANPAETGQILTYTITLSNNGPSTLAATDIIQVIDNLPAGFTPTGYVAANGSYTSADGNWTGLTLASGQTTTLTITGSVAANAAGFLSNTAIVTLPAGITDPVPGNNTATVTTPLHRIIDLRVTKTATPKPAIAGGALSYVITLANAGPGTLLASDMVKVNEILPAGFTATAFTPAAGTYNNANGNWIGLTLASGQSTTLTITGNLSPTASGSLTNTVTIDPPTGVTDPTPNTATDVTPINRVIDFGVNKTASPTTGIPGETLTYTITLTNNGPSTLAPADVLQLIDNLPAGFTANSYATSAGTYTSSNGNWSGLTLANGQSATLTIIGKIAVGATGSLSNSAILTSPAGVNDPVPGNNTSTTTTNLTPKPVLSITKLGAAGLTAGNTATYTLNISNTGSSNALGATISDIIPAALTDVSWETAVAGTATITTGARGTGNNLNIIANVPAGTANTISVTITGTVNPGASGNVSNTASVTPAEPAGIGSNSTVNANVTSTSGIVMTKTGPSSAIAGNQITYQLEISNNGPSNATATQISDIVPASLNNVSWSTQIVGTANVTAGATGTNNNVKVTADIAAGSSNKVVVIVKGTIDPAFAGNITNTATATPAELGSTPVNAQAITTVKKMPVFTITKSGPAFATAGNAIVYTINVKNTGPSNSLNTIITDAVPASLTAVSWSATLISGTAVINTGAAGTGNAINVNADFEANSTIQIVVSGTIASNASGTIANTATVTPWEAGTTPVTSTAVNTVLGSKSGLTIVKSVTPAVSSGSSITYTIEVGNAGPSDAVNARIQDAIPGTILNATWSSVQQGAATISAGATGTSNTLDATATIPAGAGNKIIFTITGKVDPAYNGPISNTAGATATEPNSPSPTSTVNTIASRTPVLSITKNAPSSMNAGETITYTIDVTNNSASDALNLAINDVVPATVSNVSWTAVKTGNARIIGATTGTGNAINLNGDIAAGGANHITITITGKVAADFSGSLTNTATATPSEAGTAAVSATAVTNVTRVPLLAIQKNGPATLSAGQAITYTISVKNISKADAIGAVITDAIPTSILNPSWVCSIKGTATLTAGATGSGSALSVRGNIGGNPTDEILITISGTVDPGATANITNSARVTPAEVGSVAKTSGPVITTLTKTPSVSITKTGPATVNAGETVTYVINVVNNGPSNATALVISDVVPAELTGVSWSAVPSGTSTVVPAAGTGNNVSITGNLDAGNANNIQITISGKLSSAQANAELANTATATPAEAGIPPVTSNTVKTTIQNKNALAISKSGPTTVNAGENVVYNLTISNNGPSDAVGAVITDQLTASLTNVTWSATVTGTASVTAASGTGNAVSVTGNIPAGTANHINVQIRGTLNPAFNGTAIINTATVTPTEAGNDPVTSNTVTTIVTKTADLRIVKSGSTTAVAGKPLTYTIKVNNMGPGDVIGARVQDIIPVGIKNPLWTVTTSGTAGASLLNGGGNIDLLADLKANGLDALEITVTGDLDPLFSNSASITNTATITPPAGVTDPTPATSTITTNIAASANVRIIKSGPANVGAGEAIEYELRITNAGPSTATATSIIDNLPSGANASVLNPVWNVTASGGATVSVSSGVGDVNLLADIPSSGTVIVMVSGTVNPASVDGALMPNTATANSPVPDPEPGNNTATLPTTITNSPDFRVSKSGPATANIGDPIRYRIVVANSGAGNITGATIDDVIPADVQVTDWTATTRYNAKINGAATQTGTSNSINLSGVDIDAGTNNVVEIVVNGFVKTTAGASFTNTVDVKAGATHSSSVVTSVNRSTDLRIVKQGPQSVAAGENISYTIKVFNDGAVNATGITIKDIVPAGIVVSDWAATAVGTASLTSGSSGTTNNVSATGNIPAGDDSNYILIKINGKVPENSVLTSINNTANIDLPPGLSDFDLTNNTSSVTTAITNSPGLRISKSGPQTAAAGEQIHYVIQVSNNGPSDALAVNITDAIPAQLVNYNWVATSSGNAVITSATTTTGNNINPAVRANIPQGPGNLITIDITGTVDPAFTGTFNNSAQAQIGADPAVVSPIVSTVVSKVTALDIRKSGPASISAGLPITYTIEVTNAGPSNAAAAAITDAIPAILQNVKWTATGQNGATITSGATGTTHALNVVAAIPTSVNARVLITITGDIPSSASADLINSATATEPGNPAVISNIVTTGLTKTPGLVLVKSGPATAASGEKITYTLNLSNTGPADALNAVLTDVIDPAITNVQWLTTASGGAVINSGVTGNSNQVAANVNVPVGGIINVTITGNIDPTYNNSLTNTATVTPSEPGIDPHTSTVTTVVKPVVNLFITKSGPATLLAGEQFSYEIRVTNSGPSTALNAAISDLVPTDVIVQEWSVNKIGNTMITGPASGTTNNISTNATLTAGIGDALIITVKGIVAPWFNGSITNTAKVTAVEDPLNPVTSTPVVTTISRKPVIRVVKTGPATLTAGATINYLITINNEGTGDALNLDIADNIPAVLTNVQWKAIATGSANIITPAAIGNGNIALKVNLPAGSGNTIAIAVSGKVPADNSASPLVNTATATPAEPGVAAQTSTVSTVVSRIPVIEITKSGPANAIAGTDVEYIITAVNTGASDALGTVITDAVPAALTNVKWVATPAGAATITSGASGTNNNNVRVTANIPAGNTNMVTIRVTGFLPANATTSFENTATVTPIEPGTVPQTSPPIITTVTALTDLAVTNTVNQTLQKVGQPVIFTLQVTNNGSSNASGVKVTDPLPAGYIITNQSATSGTYDPASGLWTIGNLPKGGVTTLTIHANLVAGGPYLTIAVVSGTETDPLLTNNTASASVAVVNSEPVANPDLNTLFEDQTLSVTAAEGVLANDTDIDKDGLTLSKFTIAGISGNQATATPVLIPGKGIITINTDGGYTFVPARDYNGAVPVIAYTVIDGNGDKATSTLTLTVMPVNDAPSFVKGADQVLLQYSGTQTVAGWATAITAGPTDEAGQKTSFIVSNNGNALFTTQPAIAPDGTLTFTPVFGATGRVVVTVILKDDGGTANGGVDQSTPQTFIITLVPGSPSMSLTKAANNTGARAGDVINYTLIAKNTGDITLNNIVITDSGADAGSITPANVTSLAVGASVTITAQHTLTQAEVDNGSYSNQASATGKTPDGTTIVKPKSDNPNTQEPDDATVVAIAPKAGVALIKTAVVATDGNTITYTFRIQNTGNVSLNTVQLIDVKLAINKAVPLSQALAPGASVTVKEVYTLTPADRNKGNVTNTANILVTTSKGDQATDISGTDASNDTPTVTEVSQTGTISLVKTAVFNGNRITYTFIIKNGGNVDLNSITLTDTKLGLNNKVIIVAGGLVPGATVTHTEVYTLSQADKDAGMVSNTATVNALTPGLKIVTDVSGTAEGNNTPTDTTVPKSPIAFDDKAETKANASVIINVLANDDPGNSTFDKLTVEIVEQPKHGTVKVNADGTITYTPNPGYIGDDVFNYRVKDAYGYYTNVASVTLSANFFEVKIPHLFTPNGDGINDVFEIRGLNQYQENQLIIVNRWGNEVFRADNYQNNWSGEGLSEGTYYYLLRVKRAGNANFEVLKGYITLIRAFKK